MTSPKLSSEEAGNPHGPAMLLVHGFLSSNAQWDLNREALGQRYRLILVELTGHGGSDGPDDEYYYSLDYLAAEFERIRASYGIDQWWVCGQSLGGAVAIQYCLAHPDVALGLIFTNSRAAFGIEREGVSEKSRPKLTSTRDLPIHPVNATRLDASIKARMVTAADAMPLHSVQQFMTRRHTWRSTNRMHELDLPVLLVNGRWEKAFQPFVAEAHSLIPGLIVADVEAGHAVNAEQPEAFNQAVVHFVSG